MFNAADEVVLPESVFVYYKSFGNETTFDRSTIQVIPNGLQMLANQQILNSGDYNFRVTADGNIDSTRLLPQTDRMPFSTSLSPMSGQHEGDSHH